MQLKENTLFGEHDRYRLIQLLGHGGYSEVWLAEDTQADMKVALKIFAPGKGLDDKGVELFKNEFKLVFNLNHPNLLRPMHFDVYERMPYLIMSYYEQGSSIRLAGTIDEQTAWKFLHDVAGGLAYLHETDPPVIHQDIKPDNVLLGGNQSFLITDFGISSKAQNTLRQSIASAASGAGTKAYMAPERFTMGYKPIKASDIWSLGASLYELMTGDPPFLEHGGSVQREDTVISDMSAKWSPELNRIITACLQFQTWLRPTAGFIFELATMHLPVPVKTKEPNETASSDYRKETVKNPESDIKDEQASKHKKNSASRIAALTVALLLGLIAGFFSGRSLNRPPRQLHECIQFIEQGDAIFDENDLKTWRETLEKYQQAKDMTVQYSLQLPAMDNRIRQLREKMDDLINSSIANAKQAFSFRSEMALAILKDALEVDPDHEEANALYEQYSQSFQK
jgi:serine/threonine protein kinase